MLTPPAVIERSVAVLAGTVPTRPPNAEEPSSDPVAYVAAGCSRTRDHALTFAQRHPPCIRSSSGWRADEGGDMRYLVTAYPFGYRGWEDPASGHSWIIGSISTCGIIADCGEMFPEYNV